MCTPLVCALMCNTEALKKHSSEWWMRTVRTSKFTWCRTRTTNPANQAPYIYAVCARVSRWWAHRNDQSAFIHTVVFYRRVCVCAGCVARICCATFRPKCINQDRANYWEIQLHTEWWNTHCYNCVHTIGSFLRWSDARSFAWPSPPQMPCDCFKLSRFKSAYQMQSVRSICVQTRFSLAQRCNWISLACFCSGIQSSHHKRRWCQIDCSDWKYYCEKLSRILMSVCITASASKNQLKCWRYAICRCKIMNAYFFSQLQRSNPMMVVDDDFKQVCVCLPYFCRRNFLRIITQLWAQ